MRTDAVEPARTAVDETDAPTGGVLVSVVIPTIGRASVADAVKSVLMQTHTRTEVIVVYDGADGELPVPLPSDERVKRLSTGGKRGAAAARTLGIRMATGRYLALLDDDDTWSPRKLEVQLPILEQPDRSPSGVVCVSRFRLVDEEGGGGAVFPKRVIRPDESVADYLFVRRRVRWGEAVIHPSTLICDRRLAASTPWSATEPHEDWDWLLRLVAEGNANVTMVEAPLVNVTETTGSASRSTKWRESLAWVLPSRSLTNRQRADLLLCTTAAFARAAGDRRAAARIARSAFVAGPPGLPACLFFAAFQIFPPRVLTRLARALPVSVRPLRPQLSAERSR